ncbi:hypothetical protein HPB58_04905 [Priestia filamentosa]|jgi:isopropylmalate/homocitrate/citramalate synthase|uniref:Uncharacterized protein n=2 Tax=Priestia endophytica TaxID=135735 RepID=A0AAX1QCJ6_9BACI|nr:MULTISPECIES: hypothetical protein [Priestia]KAB2493687.1 hypothetical protein F8155_12690 [Priestia endophytica]KYG35982.1 hypothetical protein AZF06_01930 [Priestia endophytica]MCY8232841.1 hypothetical protein [Priestia endophytica]MED3725228.1 hypothetical protein [Priestia filamentosa]RAS79286.1 hypothetical protein A3864_05620 [Priestia endophytica]
MSEYALYKKERKDIDRLIQDGYKITHVLENLSGAFLTFKHSEKAEENLHILTADARKYFMRYIMK